MANKILVIAYPFAKVFSRQNFPPYSIRMHHGVYIKAFRMIFWWSQFHEYQINNEICTALKCPMVQCYKVSKHIHVSPYKTNYSKIEYQVLLLGTFGVSLNEPYISKCPHNFHVVSMCKQLQKTLHICLCCHGEVNTVHIWFMLSSTLM